MTISEVLAAILECDEDKAKHILDEFGVPADQKVMVPSRNDDFDYYVCSSVGQTEMPIDIEGVGEADEHVIVLDCQ